MQKIGFQVELTFVSCSFALNVSTDFATKNFILLQKSSALRSLAQSCHPDFYAKNRFPSRTYVRVLLVRVERVYGFCHKEFHSFCKSPPHSAHSRNLVIPIFLTLVIIEFEPCQNFLCDYSAIF